MKANLNTFLFWLALTASVRLAPAQSAQFFRLVGPTAITITDFRADGTLAWSGATPGATYSVQAGGSPYLGGTDPHGPANGANLVLRGGSWSADARDARCANREAAGTGATQGTGFRCVKGL